MKGTRRTVSLHRVIAERAGIVSRADEVDHVDGNGLNCQRGNLRPATSAQNKQNQGRHRDNATGIKGVSRRRGKWRAQITANGKRQHLGDFETPQEAAVAYQKAAKEAFGEFARFE